MKKRFLSLISLLLLSSSLVGCGSNDETTDTNVIYFWHTFGQTLQETVQKKIDSFEALVKENEGVDVEIKMSYVGSYDDILNLTKKGFAVGNVPTIAVCYPDHVAEYLKLESFDEEYVYNLENLFDDPEIGYGKNSYLDDSLDESDFVDAFFSESSAYLKEGTYSLPFLKSSEILMYNKDIVDEVLLPNYSKDIGNYDSYMANLTWDQFVDLLRFVKEDMDSNKNTYGEYLDVPLIYDSDENLYISRSYQNDIPFISIKDGEGSIDFNNDEAKAMVKELKGLYDEGLFITKGTNENTYGSYKFTAGETLFTIGSSGGAGYNDPGAASFNVGVVKVPYDNDNPLYVSQGPCLTMLRSNGVSDEVNEFRKEYGWKFLKYLTNTKNNVDVAYLGSQGYIPVRESCYEYDYYKEYLNDPDEDFLSRAANVVVNDINGSYLTTPAFRGSSAARDNVGSILTNVFIGKWDVDTAFDTAYNQTVLEM